MSITVRIGATVTGATLLALIAAHRNPWAMSLLPIDGGSVSLESVGWAVRIPLWLVLAPAAAVAVAPWLLVLRHRANGAAFGSRTDRFLFTACAIALGLSLIPAAARGRGVVTFLLLGTAGVVLLTCGIAAPGTARWFDSRRRAAADRVRVLRPATLVVAAFLIVLVAASLGSQFLLGQIPHVVDSAAQLFHARIFLAGDLYAPAPEPEAAFRFTHMIQGERWYSQYPPGHSLLLALGLLLHAPWLIGPLCGGLSVALLYFIGREAFDEPTGRFSVLLGAVSPFVWLMSSSYMSHATVLLFLCLFLFGFARMMQRGQAWPAVLAGLAAGVALNIRPLTAAAFTIPFVLYAGVELARHLATSADTRQDALRLARNCALATVSFALPFGALLAFNNLTNGDPFVFGYEVLHGKQALLGFGKEGWWGVPHTPWRGLLATLNNLNALNQYLFGLPLPSLALPLLGFAAVRRKSWDWLLASSVAGLVAAHFFYWYQDLTYGPRFLYAAVAPLILLTARSLTALPSLLDRLLPERRLVGAVGIALTLAFVYAWVVNVPQLADFYSRNYHGVNPDLPRAVAEAGLAEAVVLVPNHLYASVFADNAPALDGDLVYSRDLGPARNRELASRFPGRTFHRLRSHDDYRLVPHDPTGDSGVVAYSVETGSPFALELLSFQLSHLANGSGRDLWTGELGRGFRNHDQLWLSSDSPGLEAGIILDADRDGTRALELWVVRSPDSGILEIRMNDAVLRSGLDLHARGIGVERIRIDDVPLRAGRNGLLFRVVGKSDRSRGYGLGLDFLRLE